MTTHKNIQFFLSHRFFVPMAVFGLSFIYLILLLPPGITFEDAGYFLAASLNGGYAHPPGYPLYTMLLRGWVSLGSVVSDNPAFLGSLFSSFLSAMSVATLYQIIVYFLPQKVDFLFYRIFSILLSLLAVTSYEFIEQSLLIEVYSLHMLLLMLLFLSLIHEKYFWTGLITGLALSNHSMAIYFFAFIFLWLILIDQKKISSLVAPGLKLFLPATLLGLLPYLYLPFVAHPLHPLQWGAANTYAGFKEIVFRTNYWKLPASSLATQWEQIKIGGHAFIDQWGYIIPLLFIISLFLYFFKKLKFKNEIFYWHLCWVIQLPIMTILANMGTSDESIKLVSVFFIPAYFFTIILLCLTIKVFSERCPPQLQKKWQVAVLVFFGAQLGVSAIINAQATDMSTYSTPKLASQQLKRSLTEKKALLLTWNDYSFTPIAYEKYVKNQFTNLIPIPHSFFKDLSMIKKYQKMYDFDLKPIKKSVIKFYKTRPPGHIGVIEDNDFYPALAQCIKNWINKGFDVFVEYKINQAGFETLYFDPRGSFFQIHLNKPFKETAFSFLQKPLSKKGANKDIWHKKFYAKYAEQSILKALLNPSSKLKNKYLNAALLFSKGTDSEKKVRNGIKKHFPHFSQAEAF